MKFTPTEIGVIKKILGNGCLVGHFTKPYFYIPSKSQDIKLTEKQGRDYTNLVHKLFKDNNNGN